MIKPGVPIRVVFFDLGKVVLHFDHENIIDRLLCNVPTEKRRSRELFGFLFDAERGLCNDYDEGAVSSEGFFREIDARFPLGVDYEGFTELWTDIFTEVPGVADLIRRVRKSRPVHLLSNINELHWEHARRRYPVLGELDGWVLSFEVGSKKPKRAIFEAALASAGVDAAAAYFIDDMEENTAAARKLGIRSHTFNGPERLESELASLGLAV